MGIVEKVRGKSIKGAFQEVPLIGTIPQIATLSLTATQIKALYTTPLTIVAAPDSTKCIAVLEIFAKYVFLTTAFTGSNNLEFRYTSSNGAKVSADIDAAFLLSASGTNYRSLKPVTTELTPVLGKPIVVGVPSANPSQGLGSMKFTVLYHTVTP